MNLFDDTYSGATIEGLHRYNLWRVWDTEKPRVLFVMLNPSTADGQEDDPTIRRCIGFAKRWGYGSLEVVNLFSYRSTNPKFLVVVGERGITEKTDTHIREAVERAAKVVVAWGTLGKWQGRDKAVLRILGEPVCLGTTKDGHPKHPLYVRGDIEPIAYTNQSL